MQKPLRIVNYAVNGVGTGHVTRLIAISRWLRRHAERLNVETEIYFLTSSEAGALLFAERFPTFKMPSRTAVAEAGIDETEFLDLAQPWVSQTLNALHPDLLLVDTFPQGYFNELEPSLKECPKAAFIYRPLKESHASLPEFSERYRLFLGEESCMAFSRFGSEFCFPPFLPEQESVSLALTLLQRILTTRQP